MTNAHTAPSILLACLAVACTAGAVSGGTARAQSPAERLRAIHEAARGSLRAEHEAASRALRRLRADAKKALLGWLRRGNASSLSASSPKESPQSEVSAGKGSGSEAGPSRGTSAGETVLSAKKSFSSGPSSSGPSSSGPSSSGPSSSGRKEGAVSAPVERGPLAEREKAKTPAGSKPAGKKKAGSPARTAEGEEAAAGSHSADKSSTGRSSTDRSSSDRNKAGRGSATGSNSSEERASATVPAPRRRAAAPYRPLISRFARRRGLPRTLVYAIADAESFFDPGAVSSAGAVGLMQVHPPTGGRLAWAAVHGRPKTPSRKHLTEPENNVRLATKLLQLLLQEYFGGVEEEHSRQLLATASYNAGASRVAEGLTREGSIEAAVELANGLAPWEIYRLLRRTAPTETRAYIRRVFRRRMYYRPWRGEGEVVYGVPEPGSSE